MSRKRLVLLFPHEKMTGVYRSLSQDLSDVFGDQVEVAIAFPNQPSFGMQISGDLFLLPIESSIFQYGSILDNTDKLLIITRAIRRQTFPLLTQFPKGSRVLVVNDTRELTTELSNELYEIGLTDINWVPFDQYSADWSAYQGITVAVHPNEAELVPPFIEHSIDIGERRIDTYSMVRIASKLGLNNDIVNSRLLLYSRTLVEPESGITATYFDNYLKSLILKYYVQNLEEGLLLCDTMYHMLYVNSAAKRTLALKDPDTAALPGIFHGPLAMALSDEFTYGQVELQGVSYAVTKTPIIISGILTGYCVTLKDLCASAPSLERIRKGLLARATFSDILYQSSAMTQCIQLAKQAAATDFSILIQGESGTGKELFAQAIHNYSPRYSKPFVAINCAAMPESLLESELFGYEGGAFTGARRQGKIGLFEQADGGTIFLDEIGDMPPSLQALLLRALQEKQIMRVGGDRIISVDVRVIAATNKSLAKEVQENRFRADLYYRLNVLPIRLPPLRQRKADIPRLLEFFLSSDYAALTKEQLEFLQEYSWPGNVRQLQNFAAYYKTTHNMQGFFADCQEVSLSLELQILRLIEHHSFAGHGIGRTALLEQLHAQGHIEISDAWLRRVLTRMKQQQWITIGRGRTGCQITEKGRYQFINPPKSCGTAN